MWWVEVAELVGVAGLEQCNLDPVLRWCSSKVGLHRTDTVEWLVSGVALEPGSLVRILRLCSNMVELLR